MKVSLLTLALVVLTANPNGASGAHQSADVARYGSAALLAADVPWETVRTVAGPNFWPELPGFNTTVDQEDPQPLTAVTQTYDDVGGSNTSIITRLNSFASPEIAVEYFQTSALVTERIDQENPAVGDQHFYYTTILPDGRIATRLYFIRGPIGASVQVNGSGWSRTRIARLAAPIDDRIQQLLAHKLPVPSVSEAQLAHLPASGAAPGPVLGTASLPAEAWATIVHKGSPRSIRDDLVRSGNATFPFRRYLRRGSATDVLETTVFTFSSAAAARALFAPFSAGVDKRPADRLDPGATGSLSAFRYELDNFELEFVSGRYVADVFCWSPFIATASPGCEAATRTLGENWYAQLNRSK